MTSTDKKLLNIAIAIDYTETALKQQMEVLGITPEQLIEIYDELKMDGVTYNNLYAYQEALNKKLYKKPVYTFHLFGDHKALVYQHSETEYRIQLPSGYFREHVYVNSSASEQDLRMTIQEEIEKQYAHFSRKITTLKALRDELEMMGLNI